MRLRAYSMRCWVGVCTGTLKPFNTPHQRTHTGYTMGNYPGLLKCVAINRNYLMLLQVHCFVYFRSSRRFIRDVVLRLFSRGTNFHSSKHIRNYGCSENAGSVCRVRTAGCGLRDAGSMKPPPPPPQKKNNNNKTAKIKIKIT